MNVTATFDSEQVVIVSMSVDRGGVYITFVDSQGNLKIVKKSLHISQSAPVQLIATNASVN